MRLFAEFLRAEARPLAEHGVRVSVIGRRERLPADVAAAISAAEARTADGRRLSLRVAVDYSSRDAIVAAARRLALSTGLHARASGAGSPKPRAGGRRTSIS